MAGRGLAGCTTAEFRHRDSCRHGGVQGFLAFGAGGIAGDEQAVGHRLGNIRADSVGLVSDQQQGGCLFTVG